MTGRLSSGNEAARDYQRQREETLECSCGEINQRGQPHQILLSGAYVAVCNACGREWLIPILND